MKNITLSENKPTNLLDKATFKWTEPTILLSLHNKEGIVLEVMMDGKVKFGPEYKADTAADEFWKYVEGIIQTRWKMFAESKGLRDDFP